MQTPQLSIYFIHLLHRTVFLQWSHSFPYNDMGTIKLQKKSTIVVNIASNYSHSLSLQYDFLSSMEHTHTHTHTHTQSR